MDVGVSNMCRKHPYSQVPPKSEQYVLTLFAVRFVNWKSTVRLVRTVWAVWVVRTVECAHCSEFSDETSCSICSLSRLFKLLDLFAIRTVQAVRSVWAVRHKSEHPPFGIQWTLHMALTYETKTKAKYPSVVSFRNKVSIADSSCKSTSKEKCIVIIPFFVT